MADRGRKRKNVVIDAHLQAGLSAALLGWMYLYVVVFALVVNASPLWTVFTAGESDPDYFDALQRLQWFARSTLVPLAFVFVCAAVHGLLFAHRIAGPIYRIKAVLRDVAARKFQASPVTLRPKDCFKDVATELTTAVEALREDAARSRRMNQETLDCVRGLVDAVEGDRLGKQELLALARTATETAERFDRHLAQALETSVPPGAAAPVQPAAEPAAA